MAADATSTTVLAVLTFARPTVTSVTVVLGDGGAAEEPSTSLIDCSVVNPSTGLPVPSLGQASTLLISGSDFGHGDFSATQVLVSGKPLEVVHASEESLSTRLPFCVGTSDV